MEIAEQDGDLESHWEGELWQVQGLSLQTFLFFIYLPYPTNFSFATCLHSQFTSFTYLIQN